MRESKKYFYARVSTIGQNTERQEIKAPEGYELIIDKFSGKTKSRPELDRLIRNLAIGDYVMVDDMSRLSRSLKDLNELLELITGKGATLHFKRENLTFDNTPNSTSSLLLNLSPTRHRLTQR